METKYSRESSELTTASTNDSLVVAGSSKIIISKKVKTAESSTAPSSYSEMGDRGEDSEDDLTPFDLSVGKTEEVAETHSVVEIHPMQNPVILRNLFGHCSLQLLAKLRLVCKQWHDESLSTWRASFPTTFRRSHEGEIFGNGISLIEFMEYVDNPENNCESKPFRNLKLSEWNFGVNKTRKFWNMVAVNLTALTIRYCKFTEVAEFQNIIYNRCPNLQRLVLKAHWTGLPTLPLQQLHELQYTAPIYGMKPNLKSLSVKLCFCRQEGSFPISWLELLSHFQSLTSLEVIVRWDAKFPEYEIIKILVAIKIIREQNRQSLRLKHFDLHPYLVISGDRVTLRKFALIHELQLPLQTLQISIFPRQIDNGIVKNVLECHKETLKEIKVDQGNFELFSIFWNVPCQVELTNLEQLKVHQVKFKSVEFLKYTPNLKRLSICFYHNVTLVTVQLAMISNSTESDQAAVKLLRLTELEFGYHLSNDDLKILVKWMPNLEKLDINLNGGQFAIICQNLRKLRVLKVHSSKMTDAEVTGIRSFDGKPNGNEGRKAVRPNITYLKGLELFAFDCGNLTERSVYHGFLKLPKLGELNAMIEPIDMGSKAVNRLLKRNVKLLLRDLDMEVSDSDGNELEDTDEDEDMEVKDECRNQETNTDEDVEVSEVDEDSETDEIDYCKCNVDEGYEADEEADGDADGEADDDEKSDEDEKMDVEDKQSDEEQKMDVEYDKDSEVEDPSPSSSSSSSLSSSDDDDVDQVE